MKRGTIVHLNRVKFLDSIIKNRLILFMTLLFIAGILSGSIAAGRGLKISEISKNIFLLYLQSRTNKTWFSILINSFFVSCGLLMGMLLCGASMLGVVLSPVAVFLTGFLSGGFCSYLYSEFSLMGIAFNAVIIVPSFITVIICFIFSSCDAVKFSCTLAKLSFPNSKPLNLYLDFKRYCGRFLIFVVAALGSGVIDSVLSYSFLKYFELSL